MKILLLVPELFNGTGGIKEFNNFLVKALLELGHTLSIVSINDIKHPSNNLNLNLFFPCARKKTIIVINTLKQSLSLRPDLILCGHVNFSPLCMIINRIFKIPYFTIAYGIDVWNLNGLKLCGLANSSKILSVSNYTKQRILRQLINYPEKDIFILPTTFDLEKFKPGPKPEYLMKKLNIKDDEKVILTIARLSKSEKYKGYDKVIITMNDIVKEIPNVKYIVGGSGDDFERIKDLIRNYHLEGKVILTGFIPDEEIVDYYNLCDVFVMPSKGEGFGIVFLEALACGKPVICGNKDGSVDAVLNGEIGILINPDNVDEIAQAIVKVLKGNVEKKFLDGEYLRKRIIEAYGFDKFKERVKEVIERARL